MLHSFRLLFSRRDYAIAHADGGRAPCLLTIFSEVDGCTASLVVT